MGTDTPHITEDTSSWDGNPGEIQVTISLLHGRCLGKQHTIGYPETNELEN